MSENSFILVPVDFSSECAQVLKFAEEEAERLNAKVLLLHVAGFRDPVHQRPPLLLMDPLEDCARGITKIHPSRVDVLMMEGDPIQAILEAAKRHGCPIIIMGHGGTSERPGHVAEAIQKTFSGKTHLIGRFHSEIATS